MPNALLSNIDNRKQTKHFFFPAYLFRISFRIRALTYTFFHWRYTAGWLGRNLQVIDIEKLNFWEAFIQIPYVSVVAIEYHIAAVWLSKWNNNKSIWRAWCCNDQTPLSVGLRGEWQKIYCWNGYDIQRKTKKNKHHWQFAKRVPYHAPSRLPFVTCFSLLDTSDNGDMRLCWMVALI